MSVGAIIIFVGAFVAYQFMVGTMTWFRRRRLRHALRVQHTMQHFAGARSALVHLAMKGRLPAESHTFRRLYQMHTCIMRRPDKLREISDVLVSSLAKSKDGTEPRSGMSGESSGWSPETKDLVNATAVGLCMLMLDHSTPMRALYTLEKRTRAVSWCVKSIRWLEEHVRALEERRSPNLRTVRAAEKELESLVAA